MCFRISVVPSVSETGENLSFIKSMKNQILCQMHIYQGGQTTVYLREIVPQSGVVVYQLHVQ